MTAQEQPCQMLFEALLFGYSCRADWEYHCDAVTIHIIDES